MDAQIDEGGLPLEISEGRGSGSLENGAEGQIGLGNVDYGQMLVSVVQPAVVVRGLLIVVCVVELPVGGEYRLLHTQGLVADPVSHRCLPGSRKAWPQGRGRRGAGTIW